jgi:hypothetical protein
MVLFLSLVTSVKDYVEVIHKLVETNSTNGITSYYDFGAIITFFTLSFKDTFLNLLSFKWLQDIWSIPTLIPDIASSMLSEVSVFDGIFQNTFTFLEKPLSYGDQNLVVYCLEKFVIGFLNSPFLCLATSTSTLITLRRFVMQGLEAGYIAGLGSIAGNIVWIGSIVFGLRFLVIPWLSLDILRYILGFVLLVKYMWDSYSERRSVLTDLSKTKIFALNFLLAFTEQTTIFPFLSNFSLGSDSTILEPFPLLTNSSFDFLLVHGFYLLGILLGSLSLLQFTCWFWENPAYNFYMWTISSFKLTTSFYSKFLNFIFLYLTMICTINSVGYFGLDYTVTNPLGFVHEDRLIEQKMLLETSFLNSKASDRNTRRNRGRHGRRERWKRRVRSYRTFDASLYDQGVYDLFPIEDLNYGFDRFWLRRKIRNHRVRFRFFPGPWMRSLKKQFARPRLESFMGPRVEFFRILFEQAYHPEFHEFKQPSEKENLQNKKMELIQISNKGTELDPNRSLDDRSGVKPAPLFQNLKKFSSIYSLSQNRVSYNNKDYYSNVGSNSFLRKFLRKVDNRIKLNQVKTFSNPSNFTNSVNSNQKLFSETSFAAMRKNFKSINKETKTSTIEQNLFENFYKNLFQKDFLTNSTQKKFALKDQFMAEYKSFLKTDTVSSGGVNSKPLTLLHPLKFYMQKDEAFRKKAKFYGVKQYRSYSVENNAPYFRVMMKRFFYYYKPTLRWERTMRVATMRKARRKGSRVPRKWNVNNEISALANLDSSMVQKTTPAGFSEQNQISSLGTKGTNGNLSPSSTVDENQLNLQKPTHFYSLVSKRASRYRYQIYKDVLQHWYYSKMNRLLLKFDVDSFIRRQPKPHFLTKNEETSLHVKRFLLLDYYNSLRWYNYMQHYNTMKTTIGPTKSLANRAYNQQFYGTFKKIRHLFAITPSFNQNVLKFDQLLYNEFPNTSSSGIVSDSILHEELKPWKTQGLDLESKDIISSAKTEIQNSLKTNLIENQNSINNLLAEKNYNDLTKYLFNQTKFESRPFDTNKETNMNSVEGNSRSAMSNSSANFTEDLWFALLKKCQNKLYDQKALKNFVLSKVERNEKQMNFKEKNLSVKLEKFISRFSTFPKVNRTSNLNSSDYSSTVEKAMKEALNMNFKTKKRLFKKSLSSSYKVTTGPELISQEKLVPRTKTDFLTTKVLVSNTKENLKRKFLKDFGNKNSISKFGLAYGGADKLKIKNFLPLLNSGSTGQGASKKLNETNWRQMEKVLSKRKKIRKTFKRLKNVQNFTFSDNDFFSKKLTNFNKDLSGLTDNEIVRGINGSIYSEPVVPSSSFGTTGPELISLERLVPRTTELLANQTRKKLDNSSEWKDYSKTTSIEWKKRRSRLRRYKFFKGRGPIKKRTLGEKLKGRFRFLKKYGLINEEGNLKEQSNTDKDLSKTYNAIFQTITENSLAENSSGLFEKRPMKQSRTLIKKHRYWKKHKKPIFAQNKRKIRKRRRYLKAKIRVLTKKLKTVEFQSFIKKWWAKTFLPELLGNSASFAPSHTGTQSFILNSNSFKEITGSGNIELQSPTSPTKNQTQANNFQKSALLNNGNQALETATVKSNPNNQFVLTENSNIINQLIQNIYSSNSNSFPIPVGEGEGQSLTDNSGTQPQTILPFYTGWDENLRKFVVTNRFLSRKTAGYSFSEVNNFNSGFLNSMNAATTLYWQIPFTTYDPDQFFALGMDGFSPIGWKNFTFKFSGTNFQKTTKPLLVKKISTLDKVKSLVEPGSTNNFSKNLKIKILNFTSSSENQFTGTAKRLNQINQYRRIQKRYKRVKKHPRPPVWFPSGPLSSQILPVHYIYVFYKRYRLPRDRYVRRRLRTTTNDSLLNVNNNNFQFYNYTLRKRVKPKRKYHRKNVKLSNENSIKIRRRQFRDFVNEKIRFRPSSSIGSSLQEKIKARKKSENKGKLSSKSSRDNLRLRQLRRRVQRQVFRPVWRYKPQAGGFVWPGDYLRLDPIKAPKLDSVKTQELNGTFANSAELSKSELRSDKKAVSDISSKSGKQRKIRKKKRRMIPEWQIQPKKYLLQKHNIKVLKKRLEKSQNKLY